MSKLMLLMHLKIHSSSIRTPMKILHKGLHILTIIVVTSVKSRWMASFVNNVLASLVGTVLIMVIIDPRIVLIISNPEPCNNQTIDELPQTLPSFDPTCYSGEGNLLPYVSKPNFVDDSPNVFNPSSQPPTYSCEFRGNDAHYGYDCPPQIRILMSFAMSEDTIYYDDDDDEESSIPLRDIIISVNCLSELQHIRLLSEEAFDLLYGR
ncbi:hypothetical protein Tco_1226262 [Tanacetum coccineum]